MPASTDAPLRFGHFELQPAERVLRVHGQPVAVGSRAFDVLLVLARHAGRLVTKQELLDLVWPGLVVEEHNIATQIGNLRKLLGAGAITTLPGYGYRLTVARDAAPPASTAAEATPHNLPEPRTRFVGREAALADLARLLPSTRLLTLTGIGGAGKTRLALRLAQQQRETYADGVWFVDLAPLQDPARVASACAAVLGVAEGGAAPLTTRLCEHLAGRRALLVLDNCEQVLAGVVALVEALLAGAGGSTVLATSRECLGVSGEQVYPVRSLSLPATDDLSAVLAAESARVFIDRARLTVPDFEVDTQNAPALAEICRRLDGIALALELAAARVRLLPLTEIAARLDDRFRLLAGGSRALPRHQTLLAAMQWSYEQLDTAHQHLLRQVSVFAGGWTLAAAAEVGAAGDEYAALALLSGLHDKSLIEADREAAGGLPRYRMLETVRQYALERLHAAGEADAARGRHAAHFIRLAEEAEPQVRGPEQDRWMGRFKQEHENIVSALAWCNESAADPQLGLRLAAATGYYWGWNSPELGHRLARAALEHDRQAACTPAREATLRALARLSQFRGRYEEALAYAEQAVAMAQQIGAPRALAWAHFARASALSTLGRGALALQAGLRALELARQVGDGVLLFSVLNSIAAGQHRAGELEAAVSSYREALHVARRHSGRVGVVVVLDNLIRVLVAQGKAGEARRFAAECLPLARHEKVGVDLLDATVGLAVIAGDPATAARFWGASDHHLLAWGYRHEPAEVEHLSPLIDRARQALGPATFEAAQAAGRALGFEQALLELERWLAAAADQSSAAPARGR